jgi:hypothetical protein
MYDYLDAKRFPESDNCDIKLETIKDDDNAALESAASPSPYNWGSDKDLKARGMLLAKTMVLLTALVAMAHA